MSEPIRIFAKDYSRPHYSITDTHLDFVLADHATMVTSRLRFQRDNPEVLSLFLNGEELKLCSVHLDGKILPEGAYEVSAQGLFLKGPLPNKFELEIKTELDPANNHKLMGLYKSGDIFCTQMESEGFRRVTYYLDRPDVLSRFTTRVEGELKKYPQLLSNGNCIEKGVLPEGRHYAIWEDPHLKPCYLFALVAGDMGVVRGTHKTPSGREVCCEVYVDKGNENRAKHALASLIRAMKWDEEVFGLEYDLDLYMIVAVDAFNFGAMENKGLNIFNSSAVLADQASATDMDYLRIEGIVAHEYFHNWTGNRITCRDWFQLTLKEGLTVFRDQEFSSDMHHRSIFRIQEVGSLRERQFPEDHGPNAHPIKPDSYMEINNFYTSTVYEKGAEVIRMLHTYLGKEGFRRGMDLYFQRHDGQAVCTEDFVAAMADANDRDFSHFQAAWYHQAGTPRVLAKGSYDKSKGTYQLDLEQVLPDAAGENAQAYAIPMRMALIHEKGHHVPLKTSEGLELGTETVIDFKTLHTSVTFVGLQAEPHPSLFRGFSAPVELEFNRSLSELIRQWPIETDEFNRFEIGREIMLLQCQALLKGQHLDGRFLQVYRQMLLQPMDHGLKAEVMTVPTLNILLERQGTFDPVACHRVREQLKKEMADFCREELLDIYHRLHREGDDTISTIDMGRRHLKNNALELLSCLGEAEIWHMAMAQYKASLNMTDTMAALSLLVEAPDTYRLEALRSFEQKWKHDSVVMNKWFMIQAIAQRPQVLEEIEALESHVCYNEKNPNKVRALLGGFSRNLVAFHQPDGSGYGFLGQRIAIIDSYNSGLASALARAYAKYPALKEDAAKKMGLELKKLLAMPKLSRDVYEIVSKTLGARPL
jgi:aminopeptidase N